MAVTKLQAVYCIRDVLDRHLVLCIIHSLHHSSKPSLRGVRMKNEVDECPLDFRLFPSPCDNFRSIRLTAQIQSQDIFRLQRRSPSPMRYMISVSLHILTHALVLAIWSHSTTAGCSTLRWLKICENALTECKKIKAVTRIATQVCKRCLETFKFTFFSVLPSPLWAIRIIWSELERCPMSRLESCTGFRCGRFYGQNTSIHNYKPRSRVTQATVLYPVSIDAAIGPNKMPNRKFSEGPIFSDSTGVYWKMQTIKPVDSWSRDATRTGNLPVKHARRKGIPCSCLHRNPQGNRLAWPSG